MQFEIWGLYVTMWVRWATSKQCPPTWWHMAAPLSRHMISTHVRVVLLPTTYFSLKATSWGNFLCMFGRVSSLPWCWQCFVRDLNPRIHLLTAFGPHSDRRSHFAKGNEFCYSALTLPGKPHSNLSRCKAGPLLASVDLLTGVMASAIVSGEATWP